MTSLEQFAVSDDGNGVRRAISYESLFLWFICAIGELAPGESPWLGEDLTYAIHFLIVSAA